MHSRVPNVMMLQDNRVKKVDIANLPDPVSASDAYRADGGHITDPTPYGVDPVAHDTTKLEIRKKAFFDKCSSFDFLFNQLVNGFPQSFKEALLFYINITNRLSS